MATAANRQRQPPPFRKWERDYLASYFPLPPSAFHNWLTGELSTLHLRRGTRQNVVAPRGGAKSTHSSCAYPLYCAVHSLEPYICLTADTGPQANKYLDAIRIELETNPRLLRDYPHATGRGRIWRQDRLELRNGVVIEALGTGTKLRGRKNRHHRPSLIVVDDPQNTEHVLSQLQRDRSWDWLCKDVANAGSPATNIVVLGTALHPEAIVCRLQRTPGWKSKQFRSVESWPDNMDVWKQWEAIYQDYELADHEEKAREFYLKHKDAMHKGAKVLWPEREDLYALMCLRATIGIAAFGSEKQNDPLNPDLCEWPGDYFGYPGFWFEKWPDRLDIKVLALDPSKGRESKLGDYSSYVLYGVDRNGIEYVECDMRRRTTDKIVNDGVEHVREFKPDGFGIETNTFQELFLPLFVQAGQVQKVDLPIYGLENYGVSKEVRIRRNGPYLAQKRVRFKAGSPGTLLLIEQLRQFPIGEHDDGPDAWELARRLAGHLKGNRGRRGRPEVLRT